jgi:hypothetical protein
MGGGIADLWSLAEIAALRFKLTHYQFGPASLVVTGQSATWGSEGEVA